MNTTKIAISVGSQRIDVEGIRTSMNVKGIDVAAAFGCATVKLGNGSRLKLRGDVACTCFESRKRRRKH